MEFKYTVNNEDVLLKGKLIREDVVHINEVVDAEPRVIIPIKINGLHVVSFENVKGLDNVSALITEDRHPFMRSIDGVLFSRDRTELICYPPHKTDPVYQMPSDVKRIYSHAFSNCKYLTVLIFSPNIESLDHSIVEHCHSLKSATIPEAISELKGFPFSDCERLLNLALPGNIKKLNFDAYIKSNIKRLFVPRSVTEFNYTQTELEHKNNVIFCSENAPVIDFCKKNNIAYKVVATGIPRNDDLDLPMNTSNL